MYRLPASVIKLSLPLQVSSNRRRTLWQSVPDLSRVFQIKKGDTPLRAAVNGTPFFFHFAELFSKIPGATARQVSGHRSLKRAEHDVTKACDFSPYCFQISVQIPLGRFEHFTDNRSPPE
nr:hypothetical protein Iba_chr13eCG11540 [Ipomoea batatas]